jgi:dihydropteroate synthase
VTGIIAVSMDVLRLGSSDLALGEQTYVMGAMNVSPESPNKGSIAIGEDAVRAQAERLQAEGAHLVDVGGRSSHFAAGHVTTDEEIARIVPAIKQIKAATGLPVSVDTWEPETMQAALDAGADAINDADGFQDPGVIDVISQADAPVVVPFMNARTPREQFAVDPDDPMATLLPWFDDAVKRIEKAGVSQPILDPGIAFQRQGWDLATKDRWQRNVIAQLKRLKTYGLPVLIPLPSRTSAEETAQLARDVMAQQPDMVRTWAPRLAYEAQVHG